MEYEKKYDDFTLDWSKPILVCITGASRGIGRQIAVDFASRCNSASKFILLARDVKALEETKSLLVQANSSLPSSNVTVINNDLANPGITPFNDTLDHVLSDINMDEFNSAYLVHNAGTVGNLKEAVSLDDPQEWRKHFDINFVSATLLTSTFVTKLRRRIKRLVLVNITSLCGRLPFKDMAMYGTMKAARDQYFRVVALENPTPIVTVLNYSPGPVDTDMYNSVAENASNAEVRKMFTDGKANILTTKQTVSKFIEILLKDDYESGTTIDYFDAEWELRKTCLETVKNVPPFSQQIKE